MKIINILLLILAVSVFAACQGASEKASVEKTAVPAPEAVIMQVSPADAQKAVEAGGVQFIDVRTDAEYKSGHAPKAVNMPLDQLETEMVKLDKSRPVYVICQTGRRSQMGAEKLQKAGFSTLYNVEGGTSGWQSAGLPVDK